MFSFGRTKQVHAHNAQHRVELFQGMRRGGPLPGTGANEGFLSIERIAADPSLAFELDNKVGKIFLGQVGEKLIGIGDDRHCFLAAPARSGKSRSHFLPTLLTYPADASVVVVDIKGDLAGATSAYRAALGQRSWVWDPYHAASSDVEPFRQSGFNPLEGFDPQDTDAVVERAILVASSLVTRSQKDDPHWNDSAEATIVGVIAHVMTSPLHSHQRHLGTVFDLLTLSTKSEEEGAPCDLEAEMHTNPAADGLVQRSSATLFEKSDRELASVLSTARRHLGWLQYPAMRRFVERGTGDLGSIQTTPTALYLTLPVRHLSTCAGWLRMILNCLMASFESGETRRAHQLQRGGHRTLIIIDEMPSLGYMRSLEIAAGQIAGLGAKLYFCCQDLSQLKSCYPSSYETFLANSGTITMFAPQDTTTLDWIRRRLGETTIVQHSQGEGSIRSLIQDGSSGRNSSVSMHPLLTGSEAARILRREDPLMRQLVISAANGPMLIQRVNYDEHPAFKGRLEAAIEELHRSTTRGGAKP
jgi:type IV secretion system protein VirD4